MFDLDIEKIQQQPWEEINNQESTYAHMYIRIYVHLRYLEGPGSMLSWRNHIKHDNAATFKDTYFKYD